MSPLDFIKLPLAQVMGGVLAASLFANVFLFFHDQHQVVQKVECTQAAKTATAIAIDKKQVVEVRQKDVSDETQKHVSASIDPLRKRLQDLRTSHSTDLSKSSDTSSSSNAESRTTFLLPEDQLICSINTILAESWPEWYAEQIKIRTQENGTDTKSDSVPSP